MSNFACIFASIDFFYKFLFSNLSTEGQTVLIRIRPELLSGLIWVQIVCKIIQYTLDMRNQEVAVVVCKQYIGTDQPVPPHSLIISISSLYS